MVSLVTDLLDGPFPELAIKAPVRVATTAPITLFGLQTIDGVVLEEGDRVLAKDQADGRQNGIWLASVSVWRRASDCDGSYDLTNGTRIRVQQGATWATRTFFFSGGLAPVIGTDALTFIPEESADADFIGGVIRGRPDSYVNIFTADQQPDNPTELAVLTDIVLPALHDVWGASKIRNAYQLGDLVNFGSLTSADGDRPTYGFEAAKGWLRQWGVKPFVIPGNHERNSTGLGSFRSAWTMWNFRKYFGSTSKAHRDGNFLYLMIGDIGGQNAGEIGQAALIWLDQVLAAHTGYNVIIAMHQPLLGAHSGSTTAGATQAQTTELLAIFAKYDNIVWLPYGHVHGSLTSVTQQNTIGGIRTSNVAMGIPQSIGAVDDLTGLSGANFPRLVNVVEYVQGAMSLRCRRWNCDTRDWLGDVYDVIIPLKFAADLVGGPVEVLSTPTPRTPEIYTFTAEDTRSSVSPYPMTNVGQMTHAYVLGSSTPGSIPSGMNLYWDLYMPHHAAVTVGDETLQLSPDAKRALRKRYERISSNDTRVDTKAVWSMTALSTGGVNLDDRMALWPAGYGLALWLPEDLRVGSPDSISPNTFISRQGVNIRADGAVVSSRDGGASFVGQRINSDGPLFQAYRETSLVADAIAAVSGRVRHGFLGSTVFITSGTGSPEGVLTASPGAVFIQEDATTGSRLWIKKANTTAFGWVGYGATDTGWTADTGTAKRTANATYTRTYTAPANFAAAGAAYVQAVQTDVQTRIQNLEAEVAVLTTAITAATQTIKALKDAGLKTGSLSA